MSELQAFVKLPSRWIEQGGLKAFRWGYTGADNIAALLLLAVIAHHMAPDTGISRLSYDSLAAMTSLSRAKVSAGLKILADRGIIELTPIGRSSYGFTGYDPKRGWAMLPARGLYRNSVVDAFTEFRLRRRVELDAMKLYFLFAARRDNETNVAKIGYERIADYSGVTSNYIRPALSVLAANNLVHVEHIPSRESGVGVISAYRLAHLQPRRHMGTIGRSDDFGLAQVSL